MSIQNTPTSEIKNIITAQREYFATNETLAYEFRREQLKKLQAALKKWEKPLCDALWNDLHKSSQEAILTELSIVANNETFDKQSISDIERTMNINATAPMVIAQQFLPKMIERNHGHICNIASASGMISNPRMSVYAASKWAVIGWSYSVRIELKQMKSKVRFTTEAAYFINTCMFVGVKSRIFPIL